MKHGMRIDGLLGCERYGSGFRYRRGPAAAFGVAVLVGFTSSPVRAEPAATPGGRPGPQATVPTLSFDRGSLVEVRGRILRSTRGHPGPVRLEVEKSGGGEVAVLVAPDGVCDQLGLSLRTGEDVVVRGSLVAGDHPILVAKTIVVDGREVEVRRLASPPRPPERQAPGPPVPAPLGQPGSPKAS